MFSQRVPEKLPPFGKYQLLQRLAAGGMGEVFLARAPGTRGFTKTVVIKRILPHLAEEPAFLELFLDEARIAAQLNHPNVAQIFELGEVDGSWYLTMEYVAGQDLRRVLARVQGNGQRTLPLGIALRIVSDAAAGLDYAHRARDAHGRPLNIVHRDVSPHNILVGFDGGVKLIDFGVAKAANRLQHTATGILRGKFPYMSPEQVEGVTLDGRSDVFSLGIVLWELLTGTRLFRAENDAQTVRLVLQCQIERPSSINPSVPEAVDALCLGALTRNRDDRFPDAASFRMAIEELILSRHLAASAAHVEAFMRALFPNGAHEEAGGSSSGPWPAPAAVRPAARADVATVALGAEPESGETRVEGRGKETVSAPRTAAAPATSHSQVLASLSQATPVQNRTISVGTQALLEELVGRKTNLAVPQTTFVGRGAELKAIAALFDRGERVVTLVGPGGTGKTRLADQYAERRLGTFARSGGAWWCDLTEAQDLEGVCLAVGRALDVTIAAGRSAAESIAQLGSAIARMGDVLLVLDNFEQVVGHGRATVGAWLQAAPEARFLVTTREPLGVDGEAIFEVPPLQLPDGKARAEDAESVQLFLERARSARPGYAPTDSDLDGICEIVKQLDGLPLAIELAAARMAVLSPAQLAQRLPRRFELLKGSTPGVTPRQATLKGAIDWSWRLLQPWEQSAFAQLAAFRGGFTLEAAEAVVSLEAWPDAPWVLDVVHTLKAKSLVRTYSPPGHPEEVRFGLLESIRDYALDKLRASGLEAETHGRHADYYLRLGLELARAADGPNALPALDALQLERDNLFQAFQRAVEANPVNIVHARRGLEAVVALAPLMLTRGPFSAQLAMFDSAIKRAESAGLDDAGLWMRALAERGRARQMRGRLAESLDDFRRALTFGDDGRLHHFIGNALRLMGRKPEAREELLRALAMAPEAQDRPLEARVLGSLASLEQELGNVEAAVRHYERALAIHREVGDRRFEGIVLGNLGALEQDRGRREAARIRYDEALAIHVQVGNRRSEGVVLANLGSLYRDLEQPEEARAHYRRAVAIHKEVGDRRFEAIGLAALAGLEHEAGRLAEAQLKYEQAIAILSGIGDRAWEALARAGLGAVLADLGQFEAATRAHDDAEHTLLELADASFSAACSAYRAHAELARADAVGESDREYAAKLRASARARIDALVARQGAGPSLAEQSANVRDALRCLRKWERTLPASDSR